MSSELTLKAKAIRDSLIHVKEETETVLSDKGISTPTQGVPIKQIPDYIKSIWSQDFEFLMNFQMIDQVGDPSIPQTGQIWGDSEIEQSITVDTDFTAPPLQVINFDPEAWPVDSVETLPGWIPEVENNIAQDIELDSSVLIDFNFSGLDQVPNELIAPEENTNVVTV